MTHHIAIVGSGPAGLMAATVLARAGLSVTIFEKKSGPGAKILIAGRSGLNISYNSQERPIWEWYDAPQGHFQSMLQSFGVQDWLAFVQSLGIKTFEGSSHRYFVEGLKAGALLKKWTETLKDLNVIFSFGLELTDFQNISEGVELKFHENDAKVFDAVCLCLGGGSWEQTTDSVLWPKIFKRKGIAFNDFTPSNVGQEVAWSDAFLKEAEGLPLKNVSVTSSQGAQHGDLVVTQYGLEGTPIYSLKQSEKIFLDLKPDLSVEKIFDLLNKSQENLAPLRRAKKYLDLCPAALALLFHHGQKQEMNSLKSFAKLIKKFPITLLRKRGLKEAISSAGGVMFSALDPSLMLKEFPGIYCAGEMIDWDAPTGGFLIQGCVSQGHHVAKSILARRAKRL